jgi:hypothetical protein
MAAQPTDKLRKGFYGSATTLSANISNSVQTIPLSSTVGLPTDTALDIVIDRVDANGNRTPTKQETTTVVISGSNGTLAVRGVEGGAQAHNSGAVVEVLYTAATHNDAVNWGLAQHNQDGSHAVVTATSVTSPIITEGNASLQTQKTEYAFDFVAPGGVWSGNGYGSTLIASMTAGVVYISGQRVSFSAVTNRAFTASKDTYVDVDNSGTVIYTEVANNAASPTLVANRVRLAIIVSGASNILNAGSVNQGQESSILPISSSVPYCVTDSLGNLICPRDPNRKLIGYARITGPFATTTVSSPVDILGMQTAFLAPTGRKVRVRFTPTLRTTGGSSTLLTAYVREGSTIIAEDTVHEPTSQFYAKVVAEQIITPSPGLHTYKTSIDQNAGGTMSALAGTGGAASFMALELFVELA